KPTSRTSHRSLTSLAISLAHHSSLHVHIHRRGPKHIGLRTILEGIIRYRLLAEHKHHWFRFFCDGVNRETSVAKDFPRAGHIDDFDSIIKQNGHSWWTTFTVHRDQNQAALRTIARLVKGELVTWHTTWRTDVSMFRGHHSTLCVDL